MVYCMNVPMISNHQNISILGSRINILDIKEVLTLMAEWIEDDDTKCKQIVVTGFHGIWEAHKNPELKKILNSADLWVPDGIAPLWVAHLQRIPLI